MEPILCRWSKLKEGNLLGIPSMPSGMFSSLKVFFYGNFATDFVKVFDEYYCGFFSWTTVEKTIKPCNARRCPTLELRVKLYGSPKPRHRYRFQHSLHNSRLSPPSLCVDLTANSFKVITLNCATHLFFKMEVTSTPTSAWTEKDEKNTINVEQTTTLWNCLLWIWQHAEGVKGVE